MHLFRNRIIKENEKKTRRVKNNIKIDPKKTRLTRKSRKKNKIDD